MSYKKDFKKMQDVAFLGATTLQASSILGGANPIGTIPGFVGIGIAGATANVANRMITQSYTKKKRRR
jgi:hypothetical protein